VDKKFLYRFVALGGIHVHVHVHNLRSLHGRGEGVSSEIAKGITTIAASIADMGRNSGEKLIVATIAFKA
jgi:hypothetical protein